MRRILYLHGFASGPGSGKACFLTGQLRARGVDLEVPDLAAGDFEHLTISSQLRVVETLTRGDAVSLIGSSLGGYLAALYAARHIETHRVVLMAPAFGFGRRWPESLGPEKMAAWKKAGEIEVFHYADGRARKLGYALLEDGQRYEGYPDFRQPALVFHGVHDEVVPVRYSEEFAAAHPNVRLEVLNSGHELLDVLEYMASRTLDFLLRD